MKVFKITLALMLWQLNQLVINCSKLTKEILEQGMKYVQS